MEKITAPTEYEAEWTPGPVRMYLKMLPSIPLPSCYTDHTNPALAYKWCQKISKPNTGARNFQNVICVFQLSIPLCYI